MNCFFLLPIRSADFERRWHQMQVTYRCVRRAILDATPLLGQFRIFISINGQLPASLDPRAVARFFDVLNPLPFRIGFSSISDKIETVNSGIAMARNDLADLFFSIDNDIVFDSWAVRKMIETHQTLRQVGVACKKCPLIHKKSTAFQCAYSYSFQVSFATDLFPKRPTGSLYCIDPESLTEFPPGCNEGDYLASRAVPISNVVIYSEFPQTFEEEISRRCRLRRASRAMGFDRPTDNVELMADIVRTASVSSSVLRSENFLRSMLLYNRIFAAVDKITS